MDIRIGIAGLGTIGSGVVELVRANSTVIREKTGISLRVAAIADPAIDSRPDFDRSGIRICKDGMVVTIRRSTSSSNWWAVSLSPKNSFWPLSKKGSMW